ncbi:ABC transporter permease [Dongshaea marina]|uniref:ABC transporter permease n=1 Tax=Dongshaea marina TaxID=2047966 RepID=UPI000D3E6415|nr:ABC transporter permease [Dongshaea marina]
MQLRDLVQQSFNSISAHKLRSALAIVSILWGTMAVVMLLALGEGFYQANSAQFQRFLSDTITVYPGATSTLGRELPPGWSSNFNHQMLTP